MRHKDRPVQRQKYIAKHCAKAPLAIPMAPIVWGRRARADEFQILPVGHLVFADGEGRDMHRCGRKLVVPSKPFLPVSSQSCVAGRHLDHAMKNRIGRSCGRDGPDLSVVGKVVQDIGKGLGVHEPVLNHNMNHLFRHIIQSLVQIFANALVVGVNFLERRPVGRPITRQLTLRRINTECEQPVEFGMKSGHREGAGAELVPIERLQMAKVKHHPVTFRNGTIIERFRPNHAKQLVCSRASAGEVGFEIRCRYGTLERHG